MNEEIMAAGETAKVSNNEVVNNPVDSTRPKSLEQQLVKAERDLKNMTNRKMSETVLRAQEQVIEKLKQRITEMESKKSASTVKAKDKPICWKLAGTGEVVSKKIGYVRYNRVIKYKKVDEFIAIIANNKYENAYPIIVAKAKDLIKAGYTVTDVNGRKITEDEAEDYYVVLDGQHKTMAFAKLNAAQENITIPNVHVKELDNVREYLVDINTISNWDKGDRVIVAALNSGDELFENMAELIKQGFNPTTAGLMYTGKNISEKILNKVLKGEEYQLPKDTEVNIERGNKFMTLCKAAHIDVTFLTKRYFIKGFNRYAKATSEEQAFEALDKLKLLNLDEVQLKGIKEEDEFVAMLKEAFETQV